MTKMRQTCSFPPVFLVFHSGSHKVIHHSHPQCPSQPLRLKLPTPAALSNPAAHREYFKQPECFKSLQLEAQQSPQDKQHLLWWARGIFSIPTLGSALSEMCVTHLTLRQRLCLTEPGESTGSLF